MLYMLIAIAGLNVVEFDTYSTREECSKRAQEVVSESIGEITAYCLDDHSNKTDEVGKS